jgi:hypothetical protein
MASVTASHKFMVFPKPIYNFSRVVTVCMNMNGEPSLLCVSRMQHDESPLKERKNKLALKT